MAERLKDMFFSIEFIAELGQTISEVSPKFDKKGFENLVYTDDWEDKELKEKMHHVTNSLAAKLPEDFPTALKILTEVGSSFSGFDAMIFPDYIESFGLEHWELSLPALAFFTQYSSAEFAIRPFLEKDPERGMQYMNQWALDENHHVRRLASEGCRPKLPWAMALSVFRNNPSPIFPILEALKDDPSEYVRKSVANNLNDISKDHPALVLETCKKWLGHSENTDWIIKRACRTLLKSGNKQALLLFGFGDPNQINIQNLELDKLSLSLGDDLRFSFNLILDTRKTTKIRLEYGIYFMKANGKLSCKIFQIKEYECDPGKDSISRKHSFKDLSTRKHYPGEHQISILVNGEEKIRADFNLT